MKIREILINEADFINELDERPDDNFNVEDLRLLSKMDDLSRAKQFAIDLLTRPSKKPLRPNKVAWFTSSIERAKSVQDLTKIMWNMLMSGEGHAVIGDRYSTEKSSYRKQFGEQETNET